MAQTKTRAPFIKVKFHNAGIEIADSDVLSLSVKKNYDNSWNEVQFVVREQQGFKISKAIGAQKLKFQMSYGDTIQNSQNFYGEVLKYKTEFRGNVMLLTVIGYLTTVDIINLEKVDYKNWSALPEYHNNPSEIVRAIADKNGWVIEDIKETIPLRHLNDSIINYDYVADSSGGAYEGASARIPESAWHNTVDLIQRNMNDVQFITSVLCPNSICIDNFLLEYVLSVSHKSGKTCISYIPTKPTRDHKNLFFSYNQSQGTFGQSEVLSFDSGVTEVWSASSPPNTTRTVKDALSAELGSSSIDASGLTELNNIMATARAAYISINDSKAAENASSEEEAQQVVANQVARAMEFKNIYDKAADAFFTLFYNDKIVKASQDYKASQESDNIQKYKKEIDDFGALAENKYEATLTTLGNQGLAPGDSLDILVLMNQGVHYTSGTYFILEQTDKIELGKYTTDYRLMKNTKAFLGSMEELSALGLSLADVYLSEYGQMIIENVTYTENNKMVTTDGDTAKGNPVGQSDWPGTNFKSLYIKDIIQINPGNTKSGKVAHNENELGKYKVAFFDKPYIHQYTEFKTIFSPNYTLNPNMTGTTAVTLNPMVFRCTKEFRRDYLPTSGADNYYISLSVYGEHGQLYGGTNKTKWEWKTKDEWMGPWAVFIPPLQAGWAKVTYTEGGTRAKGWYFQEDELMAINEQKSKIVKWFYAGDQYRTAKEGEDLTCHGENVSYGDLIHVGDSVREGEILQKNGSYITSAAVECYVPGDLFSHYYINKTGQKLMPREADYRLFRLYKL